MRQITSIQLKYELCENEIDVLTSEIKPEFIYKTCVGKRKRGKDQNFTTLSIGTNDLHHEFSNRKIKTLAAEGSNRDQPFDRSS